MQQRFLERLPTDQMFGKKGELQQIVQAISEKVAALPPLAIDAPPPHALIYGGGVRDILLGEPLRDADMQVYGVAPERLEQLLHDLYPGTVERAGKEYEILKARISKRVSLDISIPRRKTGGVSRLEDGEPDMFPIDAARYRDFTINSMALDPLTGVVYDPFGGRSDLAARRLRIVDKETFQMRGVHLFRAAQFVARFGLKIDDHDWRFMFDMAKSPVMDQVPANAIREELRKLLLIARKPSDGLSILHRLGLLRRFLPHRIANQPSAQIGKWMSLSDRGIQLGRSARLYPEHIMIAQLALLLSPLLHLKEEEARLTAIRDTLTNICFSEFQQSSVAEIFTLFLALEPLLQDQPHRRVGRARPQRGMRRNIGDESEIAERIPKPLFAPIPATVLTTAVLSGHSFSEIAAIAERALSAPDQ